MRTDLNSGAELVLIRSRMADYITLIKPELTLLSVLTALAGYYLASSDEVNLLMMLWTFIGTLLVGGGSGALNQYLERDFDALMKRTEHRPLPAGRLIPSEVLVFGTILSLVGVAVLFLLVNALTGFLGAVTSISYLFLYTPMKRITPFSTVIGAIPGALPPMMGWTAVRNEITLEAWILFGILFLWQMPHFLSLAWMYRKDYAKAGYPMLSVVDETGSLVSRRIVLYCAALIPVTIAASLVSLGGSVSAIGGTLLNIGFLLCGLQFLYTKNILWARRVFFVSLAYLPILFALMGLDKL